jgi:hypothetical protein
LKKSIDWHKRSISLLMERRKLHHDKIADLKKRVAKIDREIMDYEHDILHAELTGVTYFDRNVFRKMRP